jgi:glucoamylase
MKYVELYSSKISSTQKSTVDALIKNDLDYTVKYWTQSTFDLWEEVQGNSFFTTLSQFHALAIGSNYFATSDATRSAQYLAESKKVRCFADSYYGAASGNKNSYASNINSGNNRGGLDANSIIAAQLYPTSPSPAYTADPCSTSFFSPCSDRMLASLLAVVESFRGVYPINRARESAGSKALAIGRYKEDT